MTILKRRFSISHNKFRSLIKASLNSQQESFGLDTVAEEIQSLIGDMRSLKECQHFKDIENDFQWLYGQVISLQRKIK